MGGEAGRHHCRPVHLPFQLLETLFHRNQLLLHLLYASFHLLDTLLQRRDRLLSEVLDGGSMPRAEPEGNTRCHKARLGVGGHGGKLTQDRRRTWDVTA